MKLLTEHDKIRFIMAILNKGLLDIFVLAMLWGPSFLFIKLAVGDITPLTLVTLRISIATLLLYIVLRFKRIVLLKDLNLWKRCLILGFFVNSLPFLCFNYSLMRIPTSLSALINGTTPVWTILLANRFLKDEPLTWSRGIGVIIALSGFFVLFLPTLLGISVQMDITGVVLSFVGSASYAVGMVYARKYLQNAPPFVAPMLQLFTSTCYLIPLAFIFDTPLQHIQNASLLAWCGVLGLAVFGTTLAFIIYYRILIRQGATALSMAGYLLPVVGTTLGVVFLKESVGIPFILASALILCGVMVANGAISLPKLTSRLSVAE